MGVVPILFIMATGGSSSSTQQEGIIDYNDIMIIDKTGMGKTTTADKLLVANPDRCDYQGADHSEPVVESEHVRADDPIVFGFSLMLLMKSHELNSGLRT